MCETDKGRIVIRNYGQDYKFDQNALLLRRGMPLGETEFEITAAEDIKDRSGNIIYREGGLAAYGIRTDENGRAETKELAYGTYDIYETKTANGYRIHDEHIARVDVNSKTTAVNIESSLILGSLKVSNDIRELVSFSISDDRGNIVVKHRVEENHTIGFDEMLPLGTYHFKDCNNNEAAFDIENDTDFVVIEVSKDSVDVKVCPKDTDRNEFALYRLNGSGRPLMGAVFGLIDICGTRISFSCSDKDGRVLFKHLKKGTYLVREVEAPEGYAESEMNVMFSIDDDWINQKERIKRGEKFENVYITVSDEKHANYPGMLMKKMDSKIADKMEELIKTVGIVIKDGEED